MPQVEILGKRYALATLDPMPVDLLIRRMQIGAAATQAAGGSGAIPYEVLIELGAACLGQLTRGLVTTPWRTPVGPYGAAVIRELLAACPPDLQTRALTEISAAAIAAWNHLAPLGSVARPTAEQASEPEAAAAEDFSGPRLEDTPR